MADVCKYEDAVQHICDTFKVKSLKDEQKEILDCLLSRKDCMAVLPTGYGKSLPYQMYLPLVRKMLKDSCSDYQLSPKIDVNEKILVCCPLVSLMADQVQRLTDIPNLSAEFKGNIYDDTI